MLVARLTQRPWTMIINSMISALRSRLDEALSNVTEYPALVADRIVEMGGDDYAGRSQDRSAEADEFVTFGGSSPP
jgi:hypothetical protein